VKVLVDSGADPTITNAAGHDAVYEAELNDKKEVVNWVLKEATSLEEGIGGNNETGEEADEVIRGYGADSKAGGEDVDAEVLKADFSNVTMKDE